jgi:hypothetical protein
MRGAVRQLVPFALACALGLSACNVPDRNAKPEFGDSGLPKNCRAFVQYAIDAYRAGRYSADDTLDSLERNCGANGYSW